MNLNIALKPEFISDIQNSIKSWESLNLDEDTILDLAKLFIDRNLTSNDIEIKVENAK